MKYIKIIMITLLVFGLLYLGFRGISIDEAIQALKNASIWAIIIFFFASILQFFIRAYRWGLLLRPYKKRIPLMTLYNFTVIGYVLNFIPGKVGEFAKAFLLAKEEGIEKGIGMGSVFLERIIDILSIILIFLVSLILIPDLNSPFFISLQSNAIWFLGVICFIFLILVLLNYSFFFNLAEKIIRLLCKMVPRKFRETMTGFLINFTKGIRLRLGLLDSIKLILASILVWVFLIPFYWIMLKGFHIDITLAETTAHISLLVASAAIPTPGMAGTFEAGSILSLKEILGNAIEAKAMAYTIILHLVILLSQIVTGFIAFKMQGLNLSILEKVRKEK